MTLPPTGHEPVMLNEVLEHLSPVAGQTIVDCTIGRAGHALAIGQRLGNRRIADRPGRRSQESRVCGGDIKGSGMPSPAIPGKLREIIDGSRRSRQSAGERHPGRSGRQHQPALRSRLRNEFRPPQARWTCGSTRICLKMRRTSSIDCLKNRWPTSYMNWRRSVIRGKLRERLSKRRRVSPIKDTEALAELVRSAIPRRGGPPARIDPATRTFLALRMAVNREMENLAELLKQGPAALNPGGRMAVISFQSMEDRLVKQAFRSLEQTGLMKVITKKPLSPTAEESARNPRSRSAKMRVIQKLATDKNQMNTDKSE